MSFVRIAEDEHDEEPIEIPVENDGTLFLSSICAQFPGACGLKYRNPETHTMRGVKVVDGILYPPDVEQFWKNYLYITVYPKDNKRKMEEDQDSQSIRSKRPAQKCSDLIVLGLPWKVTEKDLEDYFAPFGELVMTLIKRDAAGKSRGYGFIRFANYEAQETVIKQRHQLDGRWCDVKIPHSKVQSSGQTSGKVFVGRITDSMTKEDLKSYFEHFGEVDDVYIPTPFRAFAFVTFRDSAVAARLIGEDQVINGVSVYINTADPKGTKEQSKPNTENMSYQYQSGSSRSNQSGRYYGAAPNSQGQYSGDMQPNLPYNPAGGMGVAGGQGNFSGGFNMMNPAVLAAALGSWNSMLNGMFGEQMAQNMNKRPGGSGNRPGWPTDVKDSPPWNNKGDTKWS
uniref:Tardbp protein n=1 Tax=Phallusia mammillata TaxID=59560 RepID=A0A6F9DTP1_9ASCI|nr:Tardbp protein [Phallusia mammillata]